MDTETDRQTDRQTDRVSSRTYEISGVVVRLTMHAEFAKEPNNLVSRTEVRHLQHQRDIDCT